MICKSSKKGKQIIRGSARPFGHRKKSFFLLPLPHHPRFYLLSFQASKIAKMSPEDPIRRGNTSNQQFKNLDELDEDVASLIGQKDLE